MTLMQTPAAPLASRPVPRVTFLLETGTVHDFETDRQETRTVGLDAAVRELAEWPFLEFRIDPFHTRTAHAVVDRHWEYHRNRMVRISRPDGTPLDARMARWLADRSEWFRNDFPE